MSVFAGARKCDLKILAEELGETVNDSHKLKDLKKIILASKEYDEESAKEWMNTIINERKEREENEIRQQEIAERRRQDEIQIAEQKKQEEIEIRKLEYEERKRKDEVEFELQKIRLGAEAKQAEILNTWVTHLLGLLPYDVAQLMAREPDEIANDYGEVKKILLKRYKLTPEKFRQTIFMHNKNLGSTWKNFAYELRSFFNEWVNGVEADSFEKLSDLIITDKIKRKVSQGVKDHFIDDWSKLNSPDDLVEILDDYDTLRSTLRSKRPRKEWHYDKQESLKDDSAFTTNGNKKLYCITHNERGQPKFFNCSKFAHISKDCPVPKPLITCRMCNKTGHIAKNCVVKTINHSLSVRQVSENSEEGNSYLKKAKLNNFDPVKALIDTGSSCCLLKTSVAQKLKLKPEPTVNDIYGFGNQKMSALTSMGRITADIEVDNVKGEGISVYVVPDEAQPVDLIIGRTWLDLPHIAYIRIGNRVHIGYREYEPFRNFPTDENISRICLKALEATKLEKNTVDLVSYRAESIENGLIMIENPPEELDAYWKLKTERRVFLWRILATKILSF
ncbi:hypothetical protein AVEN_187951-1 [Araneus ventricosus]|uniref:CCHC-type domain-containing protein n=1 Tax=Araneus ventricosus TaxID=182803 RepID=A0A4Y2DYJ3_ARAVE|nr:hypothetical protein AVEN_187951-1 [Araneus ventricosus]